MNEKINEMKITDIIFWIEEKIKIIFQSIYIYILLYIYIVIIGNHKCRE